jgi:hypothetical protein
MRTERSFGTVTGLALCLASALSAMSAEPLVLDLSKFQTEKFVADGKTNSYWRTAAGRQVFDGLPFQIDGRGCVYGKKLGAERRDNTNTHPDFVGIQIGRKFDELHLLHVTQWADVEGQEIARIRLNYADGSKQEFPIRFGGHVRDWHRMPSEEKELLTDPNTKIVWRAPGVPRIKSTLRLFKTRLSSPYPEKEVATMDVISAKHLAGYDLIAATVADHDPSRPVTAPRPPEEPERRFDGTLTVQVSERGSGKPVAGALVEPTLNVDEVNVIAIPVLTSAAGEAQVRYPSGRTTFASVAVTKDGLASRQAANGLDPGPTNYIQVELTVPPRISGVVRDSTGTALAGVELAFWPEWRANSKEGKTDAEGRFVLTWQPQNQNNSEEAVVLVARDLKRNLALSQSVEEDTTNLDLRLEPALTLTGRAAGADGKALTNIQAEITFWTEHMGAGFGKPIRASADGRFEIKALPAGRHYGVSVSAKGYGRVNRDIKNDVEGLRVELEPCELPLADQRIAGVVLDADDKPVANANIFGYGEGQPEVNGRTDAKGRFAFSHVCAGPITMQANSPSGGFGSAAVEGGDTNITVQIGVRESYSESQSATRIRGVVTDAEGKPVPKALVSLFPSYSPAEKQTDTEGRFTVSFDPNQFGSMGGGTPVLVARDATRNLAAAVDLEEGATNASVRLGPALILAGRITDADGKAITNAQAQAFFHTERRSSSLGASVRADAEGRFEIKGLPQGRQYTVNTSARGFGQERRNVEAGNTATNRFELQPFRLVRADQRIAGVVLDEDDKPVVRASIYSYGEQQPNLNAQTDAKGHFTLEKVCPGAIQLSVNTRNGGYTSVKTEGGDTNVTIRISASSGMHREQHSTISLKGKPLPDLAPLGLTSSDVPADQPLLAVMIDAEQRPSRRVVRLLGDLAASFKEKGVAVVLIHSGGMTEDAFKTWKEEAALPFPVACMKGDAEKSRAAWGAGALPWLILTDKAHRVTAEGFGVDDLDAKLKELAK